MRNFTFNLNKNFKNGQILQKWDFWPKNGQKWAKFPKMLRIDKNPINGSYIQFLAYLVDFCPKNGNFSHFLEI